MIDSDLPALFQNHLQCIAVGVNVTENRVLSHRSFLSRPRLRLEESEACFNYDLSFIQKQDRAGNLFPAKSRRLSPFPEPVPEFRRSKAHRRCKPDSVSRRSGTAIICLCDQNPGFKRREQRLIPYLVLLREGLALTEGIASAPGGLLPRHFTLTLAGGILSVALSVQRGYGPAVPPFQAAHCLVESGSSSPAAGTGPGRLSGLFVNLKNFTKCRAQLKAAE